MLISEFLKNLFDWEGWIIIIICLSFVNRCGYCLSCIVCSLCQSKAIWLRLLSREFLFRRVKHFVHDSVQLRIARQFYIAWQFFLRRRTLELLLDLLSLSNRGSSTILISSQHACGIFMRLYRCLASTLPATMRTSIVVCKSRVIVICVRFASIWFIISSIFELWRPLRSSPKATVVLSLSSFQLIKNRRSCQARDVTRPRGACSVIIFTLCSLTLEFLC